MMYLLIVQNGASLIDFIYFKLSLSFHMQNGEKMYICTHSKLGLKLQKNVTSDGHLRNCGLAQFRGPGLHVLHGCPRFYTHLLIIS